MPVKPGAKAVIKARIGRGTPLRDATLPDVIAKVPKSRLPAHPLVETDAELRVRHARGQSLPDWLAMRSGELAPFPDGVARPTSSEEVRTLLAYAKAHDVVVIPSSTYLSKVSGGNARYLNGQIMVMAVDRDRTDVTQAAIEELLRTRHQLRANAEDDFTVRDLTSIAKARAASAATITSLLAGVALVSLLVGGIGIMNVMLVSVTERTREIGLRMAIGARPGNIRLQFLIEAMVLSLAGGFAGIATGVIAGRSLAAHFGFPLLIRPDVVVLAVAVSAGVGVAFGLYPAHRASRMDPITALRHE